MPEMVGWAEFQAALSALSGGGGGGGSAGGHVLVNDKAGDRPGTVMSAKKAAALQVGQSGDDYTFTPLMPGDVVVTDKAGDRASWALTGTSEAELEESQSADDFFTQTI